ncbi:MAG: GreA/GreB family elongation factor [Mobilitalea sp.]
MTEPIYITNTDKEELSKLIEDSRHNERRSNIYIKKLEAELDRAVVKSADQIAKDIVRMNSTVSLLVDGSQEEITLVYPQQANVLKNKISVLSPLGTAILGYSVGSTVEWEVPDGKIEIVVTSVVQE